MLQGRSGGIWSLEWPSYVFRVFFRLAYVVAEGSFSFRSIHGILLGDEVFEG